MTPDDDLAKMLPEASPRPDRRQAAIAEAMRRFDGEKPAGAPGRRGAILVRPSWTRIGRAQMGVLASMAIVGIVGIPIALTFVREQVPHTPLAAPARTNGIAMVDVPGSAQPAPKARPTAPRPELSQPATDVAQGRSAGLIARPEVPLTPPQNIAPVGALPAPAPPPPPPPPAFAQGKVAENADVTNPGRREVVVSGSRIARPSFSAASPIVAADPGPAAKSARARDEQADASESIVVTGSRISASAARSARRGDWNICTIKDPARSLERCRRQLDIGASGDAGRAGARLAEGLTKAWNGDMQGAIADFDAAIAIRPKLALAYLNRGMAYAWLGDQPRAVGDFDQAVRRAPYDPRAYYHRSLAQRAIGKDGAALADAEQAIRLDPQYQELFD